MTLNIRKQCDDIDVTRGKVLPVEVAPSDTDIEPSLKGALQVIADLEKLLHEERLRNSLGISCGRQGTRKRRPNDYI